MIFIAGSLVEGKVNPCSKGMGNMLSDIDVFILRSGGDEKKLTLMLVDMITEPSRLILESLKVLM